MKKEIWKSVSRYENLYEVSNTGRVKSLTYCKILKPRKSRNYFSVSLFRKGAAKQFKVHRLVAKAFIANPSNKRCVNHIDNDPKNNFVTNLEWVTNKENSLHSSKQGRMNRGENNRGAKLTEKQAKQILKSSRNRTELAKIFNISSQTIRKIKRGELWKHLSVIPTRHLRTTNNGSTLG